MKHEFVSSRIGQGVSSLLFPLFQPQPFVARDLAVLGQPIKCMGGAARRPALVMNELLAASRTTFLDCRWNHDGLFDSTFRQGEKCVCWSMIHGTSVELFVRREEGK
jgi:hypothetical protein